MVVCVRRSMHSSIHVIHSDRHPSIKQAGLSESIQRILSRMESKEQDALAQVRAAAVSLSVFRPCVGTDTVPVCLLLAVSYCLLCSAVLCVWTECIRNGR